MMVEDGKGTRAKVGRMPPWALPQALRQDMWQHGQSGFLWFGPGSSRAAPAPLDEQKTVPSVPERRAAA